MPSFHLPSTLTAYRRVLGVNPAAGVECNDAVPTGKYWLLVSYTVSLVQGITQTPQPILVVDDGANILLEAIGSNAAQAASTTCQYNWANSYQVSGQIGSGATVHAFAPLVDGLLLQPGYRVRTITLGIGANSDYGSPSLYVVELG